MTGSPVAAASDAASDRSPLACPVSRIAAWLLALTGMYLVLRLGLVGALLSGLLVFQLIHVLAPLVERKVRGDRARIIAVAVLAFVIIGLLILAVLGLVAFFRVDTGGEQALLARVMEIIDASRGQIPPWAQPYLPDDMTDLKRAVSAWLEAHRGELSLAGAEVAQVAVRLIIGMVLGAMIALYDEQPIGRLGPLATELLG
ncbi:MAG: hypothetical protein JF591_14630, partial [Lysobacter sp.]|nr:hypothetical protein [Lysobacter sp.]